ncbi:helix-turn-helix domain-containing protein [Pseudobacillus sp. FSL P4-0506]|uniref:helix-turn-helix domain-containing protein n=1 Tax=Pseudobacillus sp. FSL P4-0506 TaxID=2921576 RepID=UPI0030F6DE31
MTIYLSEYQTFSCVQELNHHVNQYRDYTTATEFRVLWCVSCYAAKYPGAAHLKASTIASELDVSTKTVYRALKSLAELGAIVKHVTTRPKSGGQGANIYTIQPCVQAPMSNREPAEKPATASAQGIKNEKQTASSINHSKIHKDTAKMLDSSFLTSKVPTDLFNAMAPFFNAEELYNIYGVLLRAKASIDRFIRIEDNTNDYIEAFKSVVFSYKQGKIRSLSGCLYSAWQTATAIIKRRQRGGQNAMFTAFAEWIEN